MTIVNNKKKRGDDDIAAAFTAAALVVPEKSAILASACYVGRRCQEGARTIVRLQTVARQ